jgi:hypothetical protein
MIATAHSDWRPNELLRIEDVLPTNMRVVRAVTDAGKAYIKPLGGSDHGPHCLACELIGTRLARWFGLQTLDYAVFRLTELDAEMIRDTGGRAEAGPAFATRAIGEATPWGGSAEELENASNPQSVPRVVIFDTWTLNWDRCPPDGDGRGVNYENVLLARQERDGRGHLCVLAIDHGECFADKQELNHGLASISRTHDDRVFGLFPGFRPFMRQEWIEASVRRLTEIDPHLINRWITEIPDEWLVPDQAKRALGDLICSRASYMADKIADRLRYSSGRLVDPR